MTLDEETKAARAVAETTGKAIDAGREFGAFISEHIRGPLEQALGMFEDKLKYMRWERQQRLISRAKQFQKRLGLNGPTKSLPMKIAIPLFQGASLEENDELQDLWAKLLVNATDEINKLEISRIYITVLERIDRYEAILLDKIYSIEEFNAREGIWTKNLPQEVALVRPEKGSMTLAPRLELGLANLAQLGLVSGAVFYGGGQKLTCVHQTTLGRNFVNACKLRTERGNDAVSRST